MEELGKYIVFKLREQFYAADILQIVAIEKLPQITKVPGISEFIKGIADLRNETTPIIDLKERLQLGNTEITDESRVLIAMIDDMQVGLIVDSATDVINIDSSQIEPEPTAIGGIHKNFLKGVAKLDNNLLILLDMKRVLDLQEVNEVREIINE